MVESEHRPAFGRTACVLPRRDFSAEKNRHPQGGLADDGQISGRAVSV